MLIRGANIVLPTGIRSPASVRTAGPYISEIETMIESTGNESEIDARGFYLVPGFIDLHIHLGYLSPRVSFTEELEMCGRNLPRNGTTRYLPTLVSALQGLLPEQFCAVRNSIAKPVPGARPMGVHLEGPYIAPGAMGAFTPEQITTPDRFSMSKILDESDGLVKIMMVAPELPGAIAVIENLKTRGIVAALGHTLADEDIYRAARSAGASHCTHTYNNRRTFPESPSGGRGFNLDDLAVADDDVTCELIADGVHVKPVWLKTIYRTKGADKLSLITDSFLCGQTGADGTVFEVQGGKRITLRGGVGRDEAGGLAGSVITQDQALRTFMTIAQASLADAVRSLTLSPAKVLGIDHQLGSIEIGKLADLVLLDHDYFPRWAMVEGHVCWTSL